MTTKISMNHWFLEDGLSINGWNKEGGSPTLTATLATLYDDFLHINATGGTGSVYWEKDITNLSTDVAKRFALRYRTNSNTKAKVELIFTSGSQEILPASNSTSKLTLVTGTTTELKTIDKVRIYATTGTGDVYFEFILLYEDDFVFPMVTDVTGLEMPNNYADISIPGRATDVTQYLGRESMPIVLTGVMDSETTDWGTPLGDTLLTLCHNACADPWQLLQCDYGNYKVTLRSFKEEMKKDSDFPRNYTVTMKEFSRSNLSRDIWINGWKGY